MAFTLRPDDTQQAALTAIQEITGERTQTKALWRAIGAYPKLRENNEAQAQRIRDLEGALIEVRSWRAEVDKARADLAEAERQLAASTDAAEARLLAPARDELI